MKSYPTLVYNNRLGNGVHGDNETPELEIPAKGFPGLDWETCMTCRPGILYLHLFNWPANGILRLLKTNKKPPACPPLLLIPSHPSSPWTSRERITRPGEFEVICHLACASGSDGSEFTFSSGDAKLTGKTTATAGREDYQSIPIIRIRIGQSGTVSIRIPTPANPGWAS